MKGQRKNENNRATKNNWRQYFIDKLCTSGQFSLDQDFERGETAFTVFKSTDTGKSTTIKIGILKKGDLITLEFIDPRTPGFNKQQEQEYFYKFDFYPDKSYGGPGIEFNQHNIDHFDKFLKQGLRGREVQYIKNGRIIRADIFQYYGANDDNSYGITVSLEPLSIKEKLRILFKGREEFYDSKREILLSDIFGGI